MDVDEFWTLIEESRTRDGDCEEQSRRLVDLLTRRPPDDIADFQRHLDDRMAETYRWDLWAVAYIVNGGCSDDGFDYFRGWLIAQGRACYEAATEEAERAVDHLEPGDEADCEDILSSAREAFEKSTGGDLDAHLDRAGYVPPVLDEPAGEAWEEDDVAEVFPALARRFEF